MTVTEGTMLIIPVVQASHYGRKMSICCPTPWPPGSIDACTIPETTTLVKFAAAEQNQFKNNDNHATDSGAQAVRAAHEG
jgi:hypothetical protein